MVYSEPDALRTIDCSKMHKCCFVCLVSTEWETVLWRWEAWSFSPPLSLCVSVLNASLKNRDRETPVLLSFPFVSQFASCVSALLGPFTPTLHQVHLWCCWLLPLPLATSCSFLGQGEAFPSFAFISTEALLATVRTCVGFYNCFEKWIKLYNKMALRRYSLVLLIKQLTAIN